MTKSLRPAAKPHPDSGFTLVELMVALACVMILAGMALPRVSGYLRQGHLDAAKPYLSEIAARERNYKAETGQYCCTTGTLNENALLTGLGVNLADTGDFCFVVICQSSVLCQAVSGPGFITATSGTAPDFEVWAILQDGTSAANVGPGGASCTPATGKVAASGFVAGVSTSSAGRGGQVVVLRFPPPPTGIGLTGQYRSMPFLWQDGISATDAMSP